MKKIVLVFILISGYAFSQTINDYQYVIVPAQFTDFKVNGKYSLNVSTKLLLQKYGFKAFLTTDSIPNEIANSNCKKLFADLVKDNGLLNVKIKIVLKDCRDKVLYESAYGESNEKELSIAYNIALREAAKSFEKLNYKYNGKNDIVTKQVEIKNETTISEKLGGRVESTDINRSNSTSAFYFAQQITNGYQVVDSEPKVIMMLMNTSQKNVFIGAKGNINGVVISKNGQWFFEYYKDGNLVSEFLNLKF